MDTILFWGEIGSNFAEYSEKRKLPFVLIIDKDRNAPSAQKANIIKDANELATTLRQVAQASQKQRKFSELQKGGTIYFYNAGLEMLPLILSFGIPEYIIPAVPYHAAAYMVSYFMQLPMQHIRPVIQDIKKGQADLTKYPHKNKGPIIVREISINDNNRQMMPYFDKIVSQLPGNIIAGKYPGDGVIMLSYAKEGEVCPDSCIGPEGYCPNFNREKEKTVTEYVKYLTEVTNGWVFESYQMKGGIGGLRGADFKEILLDILNHTRNVNEKKRSNERGGRHLFCCHHMQLSWSNQSF